MTTDFDRYLNKEIKKYKDKNGKTNHFMTHGLPDAALRRRELDEAVRLNMPQNDLPQIHIDVVNPIMGFTESVEQAVGQMSEAFNGVGGEWTPGRPMKRPKRLGRAFYRHGDLAIIPIEEIPRSAVPEEGNILEFGEESGHAHRLDGEAIQIYDNRNLLEVTEPTPLVHEEHNTIMLPAGNYQVVRQQEYNPYKRAARAVLD
jgi:hypothetical protein